ncbi:MAG: TGS domain-containing protein, partial [Endozoicomonadaceae bacterium]|nr:TGS domain-containing protein [Endozoicomonadaceae bacterium]
IDECYRVLGLVHNLHKPIPGRFKDYIAIPKANGYQSLHTTLFGAHAIPVEIQIRTNEMDDMANNGIAAHWLYKEQEVALAESQDHSKIWIQNLLELQKTTTDPAEFIENVKTDLFPNAVYVFTPKGDILELPTGATAIDFAYAVHTQIGNTCVACRINKRLSSLSEPLESGQTIEIITASNAHPRSVWLNFAISSKARSNIKHFLKQQNRQESINLGKRLLNTMLPHISPLYEDLEALPKEVISALLKKLDITNKNDLLEEIGSGKRLNYITGYLTKLLSQHQELAAKPSVNTDEQLLLITGQEGSVISFAQCCHPIPGDAISGYLQIGKGITIHRQKCSELSLNKSRHELLADVGWDDHTKGVFEVNLSLQILKNKTVFSTIVFSITAADGEIIQFLIEDSDLHTYKASVIIGVKDRIHLAKIIRKLRHIPDILSVHRK